MTEQQMRNYELMERVEKAMQLVMYFKGIDTDHDFEPYYEARLDYVNQLDALEAQHGIDGVRTILAYFKMKYPQF